MTSFFPDLNVWLGLSVAGHRHSAEAWRWLRILTNQSVMGDQTLTLQKAWAVYDRGLRDERVDFFPEPGGIDSAFRQATAPLATEAATKSVGDCYLLAYAIRTGANLVTFDKALARLSHKQGH